MGFISKNDQALILRDAISRPLRDKSGNIMSDKELIIKAVEALAEHEKKYDSLPPVDPRFVEWLRGAAEEIKAGRSLASYKRRTIYRNIDNYDLLRNVSK